MPETLQQGCDERRVERARTMLEAGVKYSPDGGVITIRLTAAEGSQVGRAPEQFSDAREPPSSGVLLCVEDTGSGIAADDLPHVFDRFRRGSNVLGTVVGSGIGLTSVEQIVHQHGRHIEVSGNISAGTTVSLWLPLRPLDSEEHADEA